jgi:hypothetical protein
MRTQCYHVRFLSSPEPVSLSLSHEGDICDRCKQAGYRPPTIDDGEAELVAPPEERFGRLLDAGRILFEANITEENKIIPTLAFAAGISDQPDLILLQERFAEVRQEEDWKELSEKFAQVVGLMRPVDVEQGVLIFQLEPALVKPTKNPETGIVERIEIEVYLGSAKPEDVAEHYRRTVTQLNAPFTDIVGRFCAEPLPGYLAITLGPGGMLPGLRPSFPLPQFVERLCEMLLGSRSKGGFAPNLWGRERGGEPGAYNVISECIAYYLGNYGEAAENIETKKNKAETAKKRKEVINTLRSRAIGTLNDRLLAPSDQKALPVDRGRTIWEDVRKREPFLYFLKDRLETSHPHLERVFLEKLS